MNTSHKISVTLGIVLTAAIIVLFYEVVKLAFAFAAIGNLLFAVIVAVIGAVICSYVFYCSTRYTYYEAYICPDRA